MFYLTKLLEPRNKEFLIKDKKGIKIVNVLTNERFAKIDNTLKLSILANAPRLFRLLKKDKFESIIKALAKGVFNSYDTINAISKITKYTEKVNKINSIFLLTKGTFKTKNQLEAILKITRNIINDDAALFSFIKELEKLGHKALEQIEAILKSMKNIDLKYSLYIRSDLVKYGITEPNDIENFLKSISKNMTFIKNIDQRSTGLIISELLKAGLTKPHDIESFLKSIKDISSKQTVGPKLLILMISGLEKSLFKTKEQIDEFEKVFDIHINKIFEENLKIYEENLKIYEVLSFL